MAIEWYAVHTFAGYEEKVARNIEQRARALGLFGAKIFQILVPLEETDGQNREEAEKKKIYQSYVFVQMDVEDELEPGELNTAWEVVRFTPGVTGFVGTKDPRRPEDLFPLSPDEVNRLLETVGLTAKSRGKTKKVEVSYKVSDVIEVTNGPFAGMVGVVSEVNTEKAKLKALVSIFGRETRVELDFVQVQLSRP